MITPLRHFRMYAYDKYPKNAIDVCVGVTRVIIIIVNNYGVRLCLTCKSHVSYAVTYFGLRSQNHFKIRTVCARL